MKKPSKRDVATAEKIHRLQKTYRTYTKELLCDWVTRNAKKIKMPTEPPESGMVYVVINNSGFGLWSIVLERTNFETQMRTLKPYLLLYRNARQYPFAWYEVPKGTLCALTDHPFL